MKRFTSNEQTAKLIELGFAEPYRPYLDLVISYGYYVDQERNYSIGELIEMLPEEFDGELLEIAAVTLSRYKWVVRYPYGIIVYKNELIDALYDMVVKLKEEGVI